MIVLISAVSAMAAGLWGLARLSRAGRRPAARRFAVMGRAQIGPRSSIAEIEFGGRVSLYGVSDRGFCLLDRVDAEAAERPASGREGW